jgi:hypothetical protein
MKFLLLALSWLSVGFLLSACGPGMVQSSAPMGGLSQPVPSASSSPHAQTLEEGEALENQMAKEAEEKARRDEEPGNEARKEIDKINNQIEEQQQKIEGSN